MLFGDDGAITVADTDGTVSVPCAEPDCSDVAYAERVALFASAWPPAAPSATRPN